MQPIRRPFKQVTSTSHPTDDRGAGLGEYAILLMLITLVCIAILTTLGITINGMLTQAAGMF